MSHFGSKYNQPELEFKHNNSDSIKNHVLKEPRHLTKWHYFQL